MIHKALRSIRQYHQLSQSELAEDFGTSKSTIIELESGAIPVSQNYLNKYSDRFDISPKSLIFFSESISGEGRISQKIRKNLAGKIIDIVDWMGRHDEAKKKIKA